jgi:hypothetical protein
MTDPTPEQTVPIGHACYDCGEVYPPGTDTTPCREQGHYAGGIAARLLPSFDIAPES